MQCASKELRADHDVVTRQMENATYKISCLKSAFSRVGDLLMTRADAFTRAYEAVVDRIGLKPDRMRECLGAGDRAIRFINFQVD